MKKMIYVSLLNEGTQVYRPVPAYEIGNDIYKIDGFEMYKPEVETWEFLPGTYVLVQQKVLQGESVLVAIKEVKT